MSPSQTLSLAHRAAGQAVAVLRAADPSLSEIEAYELVLQAARQIERELQERGPVQ